MCANNSTYMCNKITIFKTYFMIDRQFWLKLIERTGKTLVEACKEMNINRSVIYNTTGTRNCNTDTLEKLADYLGVTTDFLLQRKSPSERLKDLEKDSKDKEVELLRTQIDILNKLVSEKERTIVSLLDKSQNTES